MTSQKKYFLLFSFLGLSIALALVITEMVIRRISPQTLNGSLYRADPKMGYQHKPYVDTFQLYLGKKIPFRTNNVGLRGEEDLPPTKPSNELRVLCLGDSMTFGWQIENEKTFVYKMQLKAKEYFPNQQIKFLNAGHGAYSTQEMLAYFEALKETFNPDVVYMFAGGNDVDENEFSKLYVLLNNNDLVFVPQKEDTMHHLKNGLNKLPFYEWLLTHSHLIQVLRRAAVVALDFHRDAPVNPIQASVTEAKTLPRTAENNFPERITEALYKKFQAVCEERKIICRVIPVGEYSEKTKSFFHSHQTWFKKEKIPFLDVTEEMKKLSTKREDFFLLDSAHFNEAGHAKFTEFVWPSIQKDLIKIQNR